MKKVYIPVLLSIFTVQICCNKSISEHSQIESQSLEYDSVSTVDSLKESFPTESTYHKESNYSYGFAVFKVYNDLNQRLNDVGYGRKRPVTYFVVSKITTFTEIVSEENKYRILDEQQENVSRNLQVLERDFLLFNTYEEASRARHNY